MELNGSGKRNDDPIIAQLNVLGGMCNIWNSDENIEFMQKMGFKKEMISADKQHLYDVVMGLFENDRAVSVPAIYDGFNEKEFKIIGGKLILADIINYNVEDYEFLEAVDIVVSDYKKRMSASLFKELTLDIHEGDTATARDKLDEIDSLKRNAPKAVFKPIGFDELMGMEPKPWIIEDIMRRGELVMIFGDPGSGKTFITIDMLFSAITGSQWAKSFNVDKPLKVAYATGEGQNGIKDRFKGAAAKYKKIPKESINVFFDVPQMYEKNLIHSMRTFVSETKQRQQEIDILVIDTLNAAALGSDENSAGDAALIVAATYIARKELGCAVVLVHHSNKNGTYRGSSVWHGSCDAMLAVKKAGESFTMQCFKMKDAKGFTKIAFDLSVNEHTGVSINWLGDITEGDDMNDKVLATMLQFHGQRLTAKQVGEAMIPPISTSNAINRLNMLAEDHYIKRELMNTDKSKSRYNPWVYWYELPF